MSESVLKGFSGLISAPLPLLRGEIKVRGLYLRLIGRFNPHPTLSLAKGEGEKCWVDRYHFPKNSRIASQT